MKEPVTDTLARRGATVFICRRYQFLLSPDDERFEGFLNFGMNFVLRVGVAVRDCFPALSAKNTIDFDRCP